jgi:hypothetical protein
MKTVGQMQAFLGNGDQDVSADRNPNLRLDSVLGGSEKRLDPQVLLGTLEEQLDLPALAVQVRGCVPASGAYPFRLLPRKPCVLQGSRLRLDDRRHTDNWHA